MGLFREKAIKITKKTGRIVAWLVGILLFLCVDVYVILRSPKAQTWICQKLAGYMGKELGTKITIKGVDIELFSTVVLEGIYVEDKHQDTLLYAGKLKVDIHQFSNDKKYVSVSGIDLYDATVKLKKYPNEKGLSYRFITQYFKSTDTTKSAPSPWKVDLGEIGLHNVIFAFIDTRWNDPDSGMDYEDIRVTGINALFADINPMGDSASVRIKQLTGKEKCGLTLTGFTSLMTVSDTFARFDNLHFTTPGSTVNGFLSFQFHETDDIADDFVHKVKMDNHFTESIIQMGDVGYFAPEFLGMDKKVQLTGDVKGTVEHLRCKNMDLRFGDKSHLVGDFSFNGLPDIETTDMHFKIRQAITNKKDLEGIPVAPYGKTDFIEVPSSVGRLGDMRFAGSFEGFLDDFVAHGKFNTALGNLTLENLAMLNMNDTVAVAYVGKINADAFNLGTFLNESDLGRVSGIVSIDGTGLPTPDDVIAEMLKKGKPVYPLNANVSGAVSLFEYRGYPYGGITINEGKIKNNFFEGDLSVNDPNLKMSFTGKADLSGKVPDLRFDARIDSSNLGNLGFLPKENEHLLSAKVTMRLKGSNIDNMEGSAEVDELNYRKDGQNFRFNTLQLVAGTEASGSRRIFLESDMLSASVSGKFQLLKLPLAITDIMSDYLPAYFDSANAKEKLSIANQYFDWHVRFGRNTQPLQAIVPGLLIAPKTDCSGSFNSNDHTFRAGVVSEKITYNDFLFRGININAGNKTDKQYCEAGGQIDRLQINDTMGLDLFKISLRANNNELITKLDWNNKSKRQNDGLIIVNSVFEGQKSIRNAIVKSDIHYNDSLWSVSPGNYVRVDSSHVGIHELTFKSGSQSIGLNGAISHNSSEELKLSLKNFNMTYINLFSQPAGITFNKGFMSGDTKFYDLYNTPVFNSNTEFKTVMINDQVLGNGVISAVWKKEKEAVNLVGNFTRGAGVDNIVFGGDYYPKRKENSLDLDFRFEAMLLQIFEPYLKGTCSVLNGQFAGNMHVGGTPNKPLLNGELDVNARMIKVDYLGLSLRAHKQKVLIDENSFYFENYKVTDEYSDTATVYGHLYHDNFRNFQFDMDFSFEHFMVLNTTEKDNELYYGKVFATGYMNVFGFLDENIRIDMNARTDKIVNSENETVYSIFNIPMTSTSEAGSTEFITFVDHSGADSLKKQGQLKSNGVELHMLVEATPDAVVKVVFDKTVGDELVAFGNGNIKLDISAEGDFSIFGQYTVEKGNYNFTMKNVVYVPFELSKGGVISWNGDPYEAQIDADAVYKVTASVEPFFALDSSNQAYHRSYPVNVIMHLDHDLMNPAIGFDIELPTADQNIQEAVKSYTQTDLERNRQVLSLMVLSSFMTPSELRQGADANVNYGDAGSTLLSNFASGVLNNWLSQINSDLNMEVKYRNGDDVTPQELKLYLSTQLLNNRMTIDGNVGSQSATAVSSGQWVGDVNVEYKVTPDGRVRVRAFNRSNNNTIMNANSPYSQGVGVFYREEFESGKELLTRYKEALNEENPNRKKKVVPPPVNNNADTTKVVN